MYFFCCRVTRKCFCLASGYYSPTSRDRRRNYPRDAHREESEPAICRPPNLSLFLFPPEESRKTNSNKRQKTRYFLFSFHGGWVQTHNTQPLVYCVRNEFITGAAPCIKLICFVDTVVISFRGCPVESIFSFDRPSRNARPSFPIAFFYFISFFLLLLLLVVSVEVLKKSFGRRFHAVLKNP